MREAFDAVGILCSRGGRVAVVATECRGECHVDYKENQNDEMLGLSEDKIESLAGDDGIAVEW